MGENSRTSDGAKAFGGIAAVGLIITVVLGVFKITAERITASERALLGKIVSLEQDLQHVMSDARYDLGAHTDNFGHRTIASDIANLATHGGRINRIEEWREWWHKTVPGLDARQNTRLEALEREHRISP